MAASSGIVAAIVATVLGISANAHAQTFVAPSTGTLYVTCVGGSAAATSQFGTGTSFGDFVPYLQALPESCPSAEVSVGAVTAGQAIAFGIHTTWNGSDYWAFSNSHDRASVVAFSDTKDSLWMGGSVIQQTGPSTWVMHLDDAASYLVDDNNADILIQLRLAPATSTAATFLTPTSGTLYLKCVGGGAGAVSQFGIGTSPSTFVSYLKALPQSCPTTEVSVGHVSAGQAVPFAIQTLWDGRSFWAFSGHTDPGSLVSFTDVNNRLKMGSSVIQPTGPNTWVMHLNDAAHYTISPDEADNLLIQVRLEPTGPAVATSSSVTAPGIAPGPVRLVAQHSGKCLEATGVSGQMVPATQQTCSDAAGQRWSFKPVAGGDQIVSWSDSRLCLSLRAGTTAQSARVWLSECSVAGRTGEVWIRETVGSGYAFMASHSSKCMNVSQSSATDGAAIIQWTCVDNPNEIWDVRATGSPLPERPIPFVAPVENPGPGFPGRGSEQTASRLNGVRDALQRAVGALQHAANQSDDVRKAIVNIQLAVDDVNGAAAFLGEHPRTAMLPSRTAQPPDFTPPARPAANRNVMLEMALNNLKSAFDGLGRDVGGDLGGFRDKANADIAASAKAIIVAINAANQEFQRRRGVDGSLPRSSAQ